MRACFVGASFDGDRCVAASRHVSSLCRRTSGDVALRTELSPKQFAGIFFDVTSTHFRGYLITNDQRRREITGRVVVKTVQMAHLGLKWHYSSNVS